MKPINKVFTEKTAAREMNAVLRDARKLPRSGLHNAWTDEKGRCCVTDGFRAYCLNNQPRGLSAELTACPAPAGSVADNRKLFSTIFAPMHAGQTIEMPAPDPSAVERFVNENTVQERRKNVLKNDIYDLGTEYPAVNVRYLCGLLRLFPVAKWYVNADPYKRMVSPIFVEAPEGIACLLPVRCASKVCKAPEKPAAVPAPAYKYVVYSRPAGEKRYLLTDISRGTVGMNKIYAPRYTDDHLEALKEALDECAAENAGTIFQLRTTDGKKVVYTAVPTFSPEKFLEAFAA